MFSIVRSYGSGNAAHTYQKVASGNNKTKATMGSIYSRIVGTNDPVTGIPNNVVLLPEAVEQNLKLGRNFESNALPTYLPRKSWQFSRRIRSSRWWRA